MALQKDFNDFLSNIEPSKSTLSYISSIQTNLRDYLKTHDTYSLVYKDSFLSGSYAKHTSIKPAKDDNKRDVDIIVVIEHSQSDDSAIVLRELRDVLLASNKYSSAKIQHHSVGVEMGQVSVDIVPAIVDSYDDTVYWICDSESGNWHKTDPKGHKNWATAVNQENNGGYKPLVKIFKWWRHMNCPDDKKYPKGITLEKIISDNLGDSSAAIEDFLLETMEKIVAAYKEDYSDKGKLPVIDDPSEKIETNDLLAGCTADDFKAFIDKLNDQIKILNDEGTDNDTWRKILGPEFPKSNDQKSKLNYLLCERASHRKKLRWPFARDGAVFIRLVVSDQNGNTIPYASNGEPLDKGYSLHFKAYTGIKKNYQVMWQITNNGEEARAANCMRGDFEASNDGKNGRLEHTQYKGCHSVQCFIISNKICLAKSKDFIINIK